MACTLREFWPVALRPASICAKTLPITASNPVVGKGVGAPPGMVVDDTETEGVAPGGVMEVEVAAVSVDVDVAHGLAQAR